MSSVICLQSWWLMIKRNFVNTFIHNSEKKTTTPSYLSSFCKIKYEKPLYVCFLQLFKRYFSFNFSDFMDNYRINQAWKQIQEKSYSQTRKFWKSIFRVLMVHEKQQKVYHKHFLVVYTMKLSWNIYFIKCSERNISQCIFALKADPRLGWPNNF